EVYLDTEKTLVGEQFQAVIRRGLKRCDGVVAIVSQYSAASPWCQAELYYAHALCRSIAPLRLGSETISVGFRCELGDSGLIVEGNADHTDQSVQRAPFPRRGDRAVRALVPTISLGLRTRLRTLSRTWR